MNQGWLRVLTCIFPGTKLGKRALRRGLRRDLLRARAMVLAANQISADPRVSHDLTGEEYNRRKVAKHRLCSRAWSIYEARLALWEASPLPRRRLPPTFLRRALETLDALIDASWYFEAYTMSRRNRPEALRERSILLREQLFGPDHPSVADVLEQIEYRGNPVDMMRALSIRESAFGENSPRLIDPLRALVNYFAGRGNQAAAWVHCQRILQILVAQPEAADRRLLSETVEWCIRLQQPGKAEVFLAILLKEAPDEHDGAKALLRYAEIALLYQEERRTDDVERVLGAYFDNVQKDPIGAIFSRLCRVAGINDLLAIAKLGAILRLRTEPDSQRRVLTILVRRGQPRAWLDSLDRNLQVLDVASTVEEEAEEFLWAYRELSDQEVADLFLFLDACARQVVEARFAGTIDDLRQWLEKRRTSA